MGGSSHKGHRSQPGGGPDHRHASMGLDPPAEEVGGPGQVDRPPIWSVLETIAQNGLVRPDGGALSTAQE
jgi:hypothetical protein